MTRFCSFLLWLMMLAMPIQGFAAASMAYCGVGAAHKTVSANAMPQTPQHHAESAGEGHGQSMHHEMVQTAAPDQPADTQTQLPDAAHKCGVCASCCNLIGIAVIPQLLAVHVSPDATYLEPLALSYTVPSSLPEKPPRA